MDPTGAMGQADRAAAAKELSADLERAKRARARCRSAFPARRAALRAWMRTRMRALHRPALEDPGSARACEFFLSELYAPESQPWRDSQALRALPALSRLLPPAALLALRAASELDAISEEADEAACRWLDASGAPGGPMAPQLGRRALALAGAALRGRQVELVEVAAGALRSLSGSPVARSALSAMRLPARLAGLSDLQGFLERGLAAFESLSDPEAFRQGLARREREDLAALFAAASAGDG